METRKFIPAFGAIGFVWFLLAIGTSNFIMLLISIILIGLCIFIWKK
jgi:hypothetical protein